jgi:magnesium transporter
LVVVVYGRGMPLLTGRTYVPDADTRDFTAVAEIPALREPGNLVTLTLRDPSSGELDAVAREFSLHELAVEDASHGHQRSKLERYGETLFVVVRPASYDDAAESLQFGEIHAFVGRDFVVFVIRDLLDTRVLDRGMARFERNRTLMAMGAEALLWAVLDSVVDAYGPIVDSLEEDIDQIEEQLFSGTTGVSRRIYELFGEVIEFQRATRPLIGMLDGLLRGSDKYDVADELQQRFRDVRDHVIRIVDRSDAFRALLQNALTVDSTLAAQKQNDDTKKISGWAAILFAPTLIAAIYGMNFKNMPELGWQYGYPLSILLMIVFAIALYIFFKARRWF